MTTATLQKKLIQKISITDNLTVLKCIESLLKVDEKPVLLTDLQKKLLTLSEIDIKNGNVVEHAVAMKQIAHKYGW
jgi:hypothetical protein